MGGGWNFFKERNTFNQAKIRSWTKIKAKWNGNRWGISTHQAKKKRIDPTEEGNKLAIKEIEIEVSKEIGEVDKPTILLGKTTTRMIPYPSLDFTVPQKYKAITPIGPILVQTDV